MFVMRNYTRCIGLFHLFYYKNFASARNMTQVASVWRRCKTFRPAYFDNIGPNVC